MTKAQQKAELGRKIRKGDRVRIRPEWQDGGDADFQWFAVCDEENGRVDIAFSDPAISVPHSQVVNTYMVEVVS